MQLGRALFALNSCRSRDYFFCSYKSVTCALTLAWLEISNARFYWRNLKHPTERSNDRCTKKWCFGGFISPTIKVCPSAGEMQEVNDGTSSGELTVKKLEWNFKWRQRITISWSELCETALFFFSLCIIYFYFLYNIVCSNNLKLLNSQNSMINLIKPTRLPENIFLPSYFCPLSSNFTPIMLQSFICYSSFGNFYLVLWH